MSRFTFKGSSAVAEKPKKEKKVKAKVKVEPEFIEKIPKRARLEAHCMKDKESVIVTNGELVKTSNGRLMISGIHKVCGTKVNVFISQSKYDDAVKKGKNK